ARSIDDMTYSLYDNNFHTWSASFTTLKYLHQIQARKSPQYLLSLSTILAFNLLNRFTSSLSGSDEQTPTGVS
ncbi:hypothetical protein OFC87_34070, partial [Escherichia coli]|nr:hypothetical protein [Escherichia coli]